MQTVGVALITYNEEKNIKRCLESVKWADEIVVIDSGSEDQTVEIAKQYTDQVFHQDWLGFGPQKNVALSYIKSDWVFSIDADEEVTDELKNAIQSVLKSESDAVAYQINRHSFFLGKIMKYGDWANDWVVRLFKNKQCSFSNDMVHEKINVDKKHVNTLTGILLHYSQDSISQSLHKMNFYSDSTSQKLFDNNRKTSIISANVHKHWTFFRGFIIKKGFLDGKRGYLIAKLSAYGSYFKYIKLWEKQLNDQKQ